MGGKSYIDPDAKGCAYLVMVAVGIIVLFRVLDIIEKIIDNMTTN
jgi:hypothetical protein